MEKTYGRGDKVYLLDTSSKKGKSQKLCPPWKGPGIIIEKLTAYLFRVQLRNKVLVVNHDRLKPCRDRKLPVWIQKFKLPDDDKGDSKASTDTYCVCLQPWAGRFMIRCDYCQEWYHGSCVNISPSEALNIDKYKCVQCCQ